MVKLPDDYAAKLELRDGTTIVLRADHKGGFHVAESIGGDFHDKDRRTERQLPYGVGVDEFLRFARYRLDQDHFRWSGR